MIPNEIIDQILDKTDIVEVISGRIPIKKAGQNFKGLCPFHKEKTPSFMVSPAKQIYHCFGCGAGGNVIGFLMKYENMGFIDALKLLADKAGVALPRSTAADRAKSSLADKLFDVNAVACSFYQENLAREGGKEARGYLMRRGIDEKIIKHFRLGFAPDLWQGLINYCKSKGVELADLEKAGLVLKNEETGNWYDRFRSRIIFPIFDLRHKVLGFGARTLNEITPKYINSPETHIYTKGRELYGLNFAKEYIRRQDYAIIVEGYFDLILPFQHNIRNVVATLGTALTPEQIGKLRRFTKNVILVYDSDKAGEIATLRGLDLLISEDMNVRIAVLPKGNDPDSFIRKEERTGLMKVLRGSKDLFEYKLGILTAKFRKDTPRGKTRIVSEMLPTLARIKNAVLKSAYLKKTAEALSIDEESIRVELKRTKVASFSFENDREFTVERKERKAQSLAEMTVLAIVLEDINFMKKVEKQLGIANFKNVKIKKILEKIADLHKNAKKAPPSHLIAYFNDSEIEQIISEAASLVQTIRNKDKTLEDCIRHIRKDNLKETLREIQSKIKEAESVTDDNKIDKLIAEYNELIKELKR